MRIDVKRVRSRNSSLLRLLHIGRGNGGIRRSRMRDERGQALVEFGLVLPILLLFVIGIIKFGIALNNYITLTNSAALAAQLISANAGNSTIDPCNAAELAVDNAAPFLTAANLKFTITTTPLGGTSSTTVVSDASGNSVTCKGAASLTSGATVNVELTYPCNLNFLGFSFGGGNCTLTAENAELIQ